MGFIATLNFRKFKVALKPMYKLTHVSIRGHESSLLVQRTYFRGDETILS